MPRHDCFEAALETAISLRKQGLDRVLVCHGRPVGNGGEVEGLRYWHAWVEAKIDGTWDVFDHSSDKRARLRRVDYYRIGRIAQDGERVLRWSLPEAARQLDLYGHVGPWVNDREMDRDEYEAASG